jgi:hypothetical protein
MAEQGASQNLPRIAFSIGELVAIGEVIGGYLQSLALLPPSPQGEERIVVLKKVKERLQAQIRTFTPETPIQLALTPDEVAELLEAMMGFVQQIERFFPQQDERDQAIRTVHSWRVRLTAIVSEHFVE